jgi:hypothetical protein
MLYEKGPVQITLTIDDGRIMGVAAEGRTVEDLSPAELARYATGGPGVTYVGAILQVQFSDCYIYVDNKKVKC